jgi:hypothetical protein
MIDGSNCTHEAVFPLFPIQSVLFAVASWSLASFIPSTLRNDSTQLIQKRHWDNKQGELTVENFPRAMIPSWLNRQ